MTYTIVLPFQIWIRSSIWQSWNKNGI